MSAFEDFIQRELPKRPFTEVDGLQGYILVREGAGPRQVVFKDPALLGIGGGTCTEPCSSPLPGATPSVHTAITSTAWQTVDALPADAAGSFLWKVQIENAVTKTRVSQIVEAVHNGFTTVAATEVDYVVSGKMVHGVGDARIRAVLTNTGGTSAVHIEAQADSGAVVSVWRLQHANLASPHLQAPIVAAGWQSVDSVPATQAGSFLWRVQIANSVTGFKTLQSIAVQHDGFGILQATDVDYVVSNKICHGSSDAKVRATLMVVGSVSFVRIEVLAEIGSLVSLWRIQETG